jgi:hypothetical protein
MVAASEIHETGFETTERWYRSPALEQGGMRPIDIIWALSLARLTTTVAGSQHHFASRRPL